MSPTPGVAQRIHAVQRSALRRNVLHMNSFLQQGSERARKLHIHVHLKHKAKQKGAQARPDIKKIQVTSFHEYRKQKQTDPVAAGHLIDSFLPQLLLRYIPYYTVVV